MNHIRNTNLQTFKTHKYYTCIYAYFYSITLSQNVTYSVLVRTCICALPPSSHSWTQSSNLHSARRSCAMCNFNKGQRVSALARRVAYVRLGTYRVRDLHDTLWLCESQLWTWRFNWEQKKKMDGWGKIREQKWE